MLLINKTENGRQNNLIAGLALLLLGATISAVAAALNKYSAILWTDVLWLVVFASAGVFAGSLLVMWWRRTLVKTLESVYSKSEGVLILLSSLRAVIMCIALGAGLYAYTQNGTLAIVHTIQSMYILIPIVLSVIFYNEHWNLRKILAIVLSVVALGLFQ